jgi:hypothetical protein
MLSSQGNYNAVYDAKGTRWRIYDFKNKSIGSRQSRDLAIDDLAALEEGSHKSQTKGEQAASRHSDRSSAGPTMTYADPTRESNYVGRGSNLKRARPDECLPTISQTEHAQGLLDQDCEDPEKLRGSLAGMVQYAFSLKRQLGVLSSKLASMSRLLAASVNIGPKPEEHHHLVKEMIGKGYPDDTGRTI